MKLVQNQKIFFQENNEKPVIYDDAVIINYLQSCYLDNITDNTYSTISIDLLISMNQNKIDTIKTRKDKKNLFLLTLCFFGTILISTVIIFYVYRKQLKK